MIIFSIHIGRQRGLFWDFQLDSNIKFYSINYFCCFTVGPCSCLQILHSDIRINILAQRVPEIELVWISCKEQNCDFTRRCLHMHVMTSLANKIRHNKHVQTYIKIHSYYTYYITVPINLKLHHSLSMQYFLYKILCRQVSTACSRNMSSQHFMRQERLHWQRMMYCIYANTPCHRIIRAP